MVVLFVATLCIDSGHSSDLTALYNVERSICSDSFCSLDEMGTDSLNKTRNLLGL
jgi:hypothetical protein